MNIGIILLLQTMIISIIIGLISYTSWFSYILFLVFLGGILVLFIYITRIASNEIFKKRFYFMTAIGIIIIIVILILLLLDPFIIVNPTMIEYERPNHIKILISPLYNRPSSNITMFIVIYLFLTLIVVVSITKFNIGPLRPTN